MRNIYKIFVVFLLLTIVIPAQTGDVNNRYLLASSFEMTGEFEKAKTLYEEVYKLQPNNQVFFQGLNRTYIALKLYKKSISLIEENLKRTPDDINLFGLLGASYYLEGNEKTAYSYWDAAIKMQPNNESVYRILANYALERRAFEKAIDILKQGKITAKDPKSFGYDLAGLFSLTMNYTDATEEYAAILSKFPDQLSFIEAKILGYISKPEALEITIKILEKRKTEDNTAFYYLLSHLYLEKKNYEKAFDYYLFIDKKLNRQGAELFSFGQKVLNEGNDEVAVKTFDYILVNYPSSSFYSASKLGYAKSLEAKFEREAFDNNNNWLTYTAPKYGKEIEYKKILDIYTEIIKQSPFTEVGIEASYRMGLIYYYKLNLTGKAKDNFDNIIKNFLFSPFYSPACDVMGDIYLEEGRLDLALDCIQKVIAGSRSTEQQRSQALYKKAKINFYKNDFTSAKEILTQIMSNLRDNSANDALELSLLINTTIDDSIGLSGFASAQLLAERNLLTEACEKFRLIALKKDNFVLSSMAGVTQAEILITLEKYNEALEILNKTAEERERNIYSDKALYLKAKTFQYLLKDIAKAIENYQEILTNFPNSLYLEESREEITKLRNKSS